MFTGVITTTERYTEDTIIADTGILDAHKTAGAVREYQKVVAVGSMVREVKVGDYVVINPARYITKKYDDNSLRTDFVENPVTSVNIPVVYMDDEPYFMIQENDIDYIISEYDEIDDDAVQGLILPRDPQLIN